MKYHKTHILIIEDEPDINELLSITLLKNDYAVTKVFDGEKGLKIAREISPDLILLDLMLPGISGLDVCKLLKSEQETSFIKIIILTALSQEHNIVKGLELGADDYITKPFSIKVLNARIKSVLRRNSIEKDKFVDIINIEKIQITPKTRTVKIDREKFGQYLFTYLENFEAMTRPTFFKLIHLAYDSTIGKDTNPSVVFFHIHNPTFVESAQFIKDFPSARFLQIIRDPIQALESWCTVSDKKNYSKINEEYIENNKYLNKYRRVNK